MSSILLPFNFRPYIIAIFGIGVILHIIANRRAWDKGFFIVNSSIFLVLVISLLYSADFHYGLKKLGTMLPLLVFPFLFSFLIKNNDLTMYVRENHFRIVIFFPIFVLIFNSVFFSWFVLTEFTFSETIKHYAYLVDNKLGDYNIHSIYLSCHIGISILILGFYILDDRFKTIQKIFWFVLICFLLMFLIILNKKGPVLSLLITLLGLIIFLKRRKVVLFYSAILILIMSISTIAIISDADRVQRYRELLEINYSEHTGGLDSTSIRLSIYQCALNLFKSNPIFGVGVGDTKDKLLNCYNESGYDDRFTIEAYNTHNQYLSVLLSSGLIALIVIVGMYFKLLQYSVRNSNIMLFIFLCFYLVEMLTENLLERQDGVFYFSFFICFSQLLNTPKK
ncbi:O-antigen ligase family protein [Robertkochia sediminum]|uniref:O-antigen ligase family protein n=1 Tax=Robertkochia sediminum TaxID=2785326 RepID=UPI0019346F46|nr:O-antigen ligase family protein [Robertkochia sediminum]MBL7471758.1 O-antigen ligase family protein [Robertkochia sediminum]